MPPSQGKRETVEPSYIPVNNRQDLKCETSSHLFTNIIFLKGIGMKELSL
jgi:hypothetical protein